MNEMSPDSIECGHKVNRSCCHWSRRTWLLTLALILGIGLTISIVLLIDPGNLASRRVDAQNWGRARFTNVTLRRLHTAVNQFHMDTGRWPTQAEGLSVLVRQPAGVTNWPPGGYLETMEVPKDGWGRDFILELHPGARRPFVIKSLGADGADGGEGYNADLFSVDAH